VFAGHRTWSHRKNAMSWEVKGDAIPFHQQLRVHGGTQLSNFIKEAHALAWRGGSQSCAAVPPTAVSTKPRATEPPKWSEMRVAVR
jgi:hypothetical protein